MILGYKHLLDRKWEDRIHQTGLYHLLSVSGLHIGMVCVFVFWLVRLAVRRLFPSVLSRVTDQRIALLPAFAAGIFYALLAGFRNSDHLEVRFDTGGVFRGLPQVSLRRLLTMLALAALVILVADPAGLCADPLPVHVYMRVRNNRHLSEVSQDQAFDLFPALGPESLAGKDRLAV